MLCERRFDGLCLALGGRGHKHGLEASLSALALGQTILVNGGGTMTGFAAVQMALMRGANVIATAGDTFAGRLRDLGAKVTPYGGGMVERVREIAGGAPDMVLHTAQVTGVLPDLTLGQFAQLAAQGRFAVPWRALLGWKIGARRSTSA
jgi:NADPH:quinone reductase-like Zn-dependent oxidoreductase